MTRDRTNKLSNMAAKYVVASTTTIKNPRTGQRFTSTHYFRHWILGEGFGASFDSLDRAKRMNFAQARKVARLGGNSYTIERAPESIKA